MKGKQLVIPSGSRVIHPVGNETMFSICRAVMCACVESLCIVNGCCGETDINLHPFMVSYAPVLSVSFLPAPYIRKAVKKLENHPEVTNTLLISFITCPSHFSPLHTRFTSVIFPKYLPDIPSMSTLYSVNICLISPLYTPHISLIPRPPHISITSPKSP